MLRVDTAKFDVADCSGDGALLCYQPPPALAVARSATACASLAALLVSDAMPETSGELKQLLSSAAFRSRLK
jgi:hypothetical protein